MVEKFKIEVEKNITNLLFNPNINWLDNAQWENILNKFILDYKCYYSNDILFENIKYYPGLLATLFYRISRELYLNNQEAYALEFSSVGFSLTSIELYYTADIGHSFKLNHGVGTVVGAHTFVGNNVLLHHNVTIGEKNGYRAKIGNNVIVYPGAVIVGNTVIKDNSIIGANMFVDKSNIENLIIK